jgi:hypothetical protein
MAWSAPATYVVGEVLTSANLNTYLSANMQFLATPPAWRVHREGAYNLTNATPTTMPYDTVDFDSASGWQSGINKYEIQVAGTYKVGATLNSASTADNDQVTINLYLDSDPCSTGVPGNGEGNGGDMSSIVSDLIDDLEPTNELSGNYYGSAVALNVGSGLTYLNYFWGVKVSN